MVTTERKLYAVSARRASKKYREKSKLQQRSMAALGGQCVCTKPLLYGTSNTAFSLTRFLTALDTLRLLNLPLRVPKDSKHFLPPRSFSSTSRTCLEKRKGQHYNARDQYLRQQAKQRREANLSRQAVLKEERARAMGNPIEGVTTPFLESLDRAQAVQAQPPPSADSRSTTSKSPPPSPALASGGGEHLNHLLTKKDLVQSLDFSKTLSEPVVKRERTRVDPARERAQLEEHQMRDNTAREAINRITSLENASSREKTMTNVQRIISEFGRHNTDAFLKPKAPANLLQSNKSTPEALPRVGPDTGSSEVQIGILTAKIRVLANRYQGENRNDKVNKRNLLLLLHRRQKLLRYMEKKERGSGRWQNMIGALGLTEATWKGEISL